MNSLGRDLRHGARLLWKAPGFSAVALAALALGMGATSAIFSVVDAVLLKPLPFRDPQRLLVIWERNPAQNLEKMFVAPGNFLEWRSQSRALEALAAIAGRPHQPDRGTERPHRSGRTAGGARFREPVSAAGSAAGGGARVSHPRKTSPAARITRC